MTEDKLEWYQWVVIIGGIGTLAFGAGAYKVYKDDKKRLYSLTINHPKQKVDSFLAQEQKQLEKDITECKRFTGNIAEQGYSFSRKWCGLLLEDRTINQEGYKSCLSHERGLEFTNCREDAYQKSFDRMKNYMKHQKR